MFAFTRQTNSLENKRCANGSKLKNKIKKIKIKAIFLQYRQ